MFVPFLIVYLSAPSARALCTEFRVYAASRLKAELQTIQSAVADNATADAVHMIGLRVLTEG
jgi:hypothetical protein